MPSFHPKQAFELAKQAEQAGDLKQAASHFASLSVYLRRRGKVAEALTLIQHAVTLVPHYARLHLQLALCAEVAGQPELADVALAGFTQRVVEKGQVEKFQPVVESMLKSHARLRQAFFEQLLSLDRTGVQAFLGLARALEDQQALDLALKVLLEALAIARQDEDILQAITAVVYSIDRKNAIFHWERFREGKLSAADLAIVLAPGRPREEVPEPSVAPIEEPPSGEKPLKVLIDELEREMGLRVESPEQQVAPLLQEFRRRSDPVLGHDGDARIDMGLAFMEMELWKEAQDEFERVPVTHARFAEAQALLGQLLERQGSDLAALDAYQRALRTEPLPKLVALESRYQMVRLYIRLGDFQQALARVSQLLDDEPEYRDLRALKNQIESALGLDVENR